MQQTSFPYYSMTPPPTAMVIESPTPPPADALLLERIRSQVEYYFSENNLARDSYLQSYLMNPEHYGLVPVSVIADFPKLRSIQASYFAGHHVPAINASPVHPWLIYEALRFSPIVRVSVDGRFLSRIPTSEQALPHASPSYHVPPLGSNKSNATSPTSFESSSDASHTMKERPTIKLTGIPEGLRAPEVWGMFATASAKPSGIRYDEKDKMYSVYFETEDLATAALATFQTSVIGNATLESVNAELIMESTPASTPTKEHQHHQTTPIMLPAIAVEAASAYPPPVHAVPVQSFPPHVTPMGYYPYGYAIMPSSAAHPYEQQQQQGFVAIGPLYSAPGATFPNYPPPSLHHHQQQNYHPHRPPNQIYVKPPKKTLPPDQGQASPVPPQQQQQQRSIPQNTSTVTKKTPRKANHGARSYSSSHQQQQRTVPNGGGKTSGNRSGKKNHHSAKKEASGRGTGASGAIALVEDDFPALHGSNTTHNKKNPTPPTSSAHTNKKAAYAEAVKSKKAVPPPPPTKETTTTDLHKKMNKLDIAASDDTKPEKAKTCDHKL